MKSKIFIFLLICFLFLNNYGVCKQKLTIRKKFVKKHFVPSKNIRRLIKFPDVSTGIFFDFKLSKIRTSINFEMYDRKVKIDLVLGDDFIAVAVGKKLIRIFEIGINIFMGYDLYYDKRCYGIGVTIINF